ncbi:MAG: transcriptional regulator [Piscirickettsiaceae bacterium]|nr:MAG: transcriptional regulator [Piscirickettsiaceae bacterium]
MGIEAVVLKQYQNKVNQALKQFGDYAMPTTEGCLKTVRKALGMSGSQLAKRLGVTKGRISQAESAELTGSATLKSMHSLAQAMNCRFVYAVIPEKEIESVIRARAILKAKEQIKVASTQMALESQTLSEEQLAFEVERLATEIIEKMPSDLWNDE